jgi:hypothetical protein
LCRVLCRVSCLHSVRHVLRLRYVCCMQAELGELGKWVVSVAYSSYHFVVVSSYLPFPPPNPSQHSPNSRPPTHWHPQAYILPAAQNRHVCALHAMISRERVRRRRRHTQCRHIPQLNSHRCNCMGACFVRSLVDVLWGTLGFLSLVVLGRGLLLCIEQRRRLGLVIAIGVHAGLDLAVALCLGQMYFYWVPRGPDGRYDNATAASALFDMVTGTSRS